MKSPNDLFLKLNLTIRQQFSTFGTYQIWQVQRLDLALPDIELYHFLEILSFLDFHNFNFPLIKHLISVTSLLMSFPPLGFSSACIASHVESTRHSCIDHPESSSHTNTCIHSSPPQTPKPNTESTFSCRPLPFLALSFATVLSPILHSVLRHSTLILKY